MLQRYGLAVVSHLLLVLAWYLFVELGHVPKFVMGVKLGVLLLHWGLHPPSGPNVRSRQALTRPTTRGRCGNASFKNGG